MVRFNNRTLLLLIKTAIIYLSVYTITNKINTFRLDHYNLYFPWELKIPLVPEFIIFYLSTFILPALPIALLDFDEKRKVSKAVIISTLIGGTIFLLIPTKLGFIRSTEGLGVFEFLYKVMWFLDEPHNLFPSQHVSISFLLIAPCLKKITFIKRILLVLLLILISLSILFVHQHHLLDLIGGLFLGVFCHKVSNIKIKQKLI